MSFLGVNIYNEQIEVSNDKLGGLLWPTSHGALLALTPGLMAATSRAI